jgi:hypothetical protein
MKEVKRISIVHDLASMTGSDYTSSEVYMYTSIETGESKIILKRTVGQSFPVQEYEKVMKIYEKLHGSGKVITIGDLLKIRGFKEE